MIGRLYKGLQGLVKSRKIELVEGEGRLVGPTTVEVGGRRLQGRNVVLATGSYARSAARPGDRAAGSSPATRPSPSTACRAASSSSAAA